MPGRATETGRPFLGGQGYAITRPGRSTAKSLRITPADG